MHPKRLNSDTFANLTFVSHISLETVETISSCQQVKKKSFDFNFGTFQRL